MPTYTFYNKKTKKSTTSLMTLAEHEILSKNPDYQQIPVALNMHSGLGLGFRKIDDGFNDLLKTMKKKNSGGVRSARSTIRTK